MLTSSVDAPEEALSAAMKYASLGLAVKGYAGEHELSKVALLSYRTRGNEIDDLQPSTWVPYAFAFWVMQGMEIVARVSVAPASGGFRAEAMEFVSGKEGFAEAIATADRLADEPGEHEMHMVEIPQFNALLIRVTGDKPRFVDRVRGDVYTEEGIVDELARRRRIVLGIEPNEDDTPGFRG